MKYYQATITYATGPRVPDDVALETEQAPRGNLWDALGDARNEACRVAGTIEGLTEIRVIVEVRP